MTPNATILHINDMHLVVLEQKNDAVQVQGKDSEDSSYTNQLVISNVQQQDSGRYFCVVTNAAGQFVYRSAYLEVVETVRFSPMGDAPNIIIGVVVACIGEGSTTATFSSSSTSSTSTTNVHHCIPNYYYAQKVLNKPPPPRIPLPMAPPISPPPAKFNASLMPIQHSTPQPHRHIWHDELGNASQAGFHSATMDRSLRISAASNWNVQQYSVAHARSRQLDEKSSTHAPPPCHARPTTPVSEAFYDQDPHSRFLDDEREVWQPGSAISIHSTSTLLHHSSVAAIGNRTHSRDHL
uniref:Immunoglobulin domain-containing protein n=1 Tax=Ditylenchus dipsaci TaxID=166011 RepID=A0A915D194_9BILA